jgi:ribonuclease VapC
LLSDFLANIEADVIPFSQNHLKVAIDAFLRYGRGRNPAALNFGDCLSYAIASVANMPLLFIGNDFSKTDILQ